MLYRSLHHYLIPCLLTFLLVAFLATSHAQCPPPSIDHQPVRVGVKILVNEILSISTVEETFDMDGYLTLVWNDEIVRELFPASEYETVMIYNESALEEVLGCKLWYPNLEFMNSVETKQVGKRRLEIRNGQLFYAERFVVKLSSHMDFTDFPFDEQIFRMELESFGFDGEHMEFYSLEPTPGKLEIGNDAWEFLHAESVAGAVTYDSPIASKMDDWTQFSRFAFQIYGKRRVGYFIWQFFLPLFILIVATWFIPTLWKSGSAQELIFTMLLTTIMFSFYTSNFLPQLPYNTFLEVIVIVTNAVVLVTMLLVLTRRKAEKAHWIYSAWTVPVLSIGAYLFTIWKFFG